MTSHLGLKIATITNREKILEKYIYFHRPIFTHMNMLICHRHSKRMRSCVRKESWVRNPVVVEALHSLHCTILSIYMYSLTVTLIMGTPIGNAFGVTAREPLAQTDRRSECQLGLWSTRSHGSKKWPAPYGSGRQAPPTPLAGACKCVKYTWNTHLKSCLDT